VCSNTFLPYGWHHLDDRDIAAVTAVLQHGSLTQGQEIERFEAAMLAYCGAAQAVACQSGSAGLILACRALNLAAGDWLWTTPITFAASATCALHCGAQVDFVDVDPDTALISISALQTQLAQARREHRLPKIVVAVHYGGQVCDMAGLHALAADYGFEIIEDAAHALGARYPDGCLVGSHPASAATVFSFHPVKLITTGEGGMVLTARPELATRMRTLRSHAIHRDPSAGATWHYDIAQLGYHFRLTDIQAALGRSQLAQIETFLSQRRQRAQWYHSALSHLPLRLPVHGLSAHHAWHLYPVHFATSQLRQHVYHALHQQQIGVQVHYIPLYRLTLFNQHTPDRYPGAERFYAGVLSLPLFPDLTDVQQQRVVKTLKSLSL
jgi:UDP-4-amino-4,6-dideoxy-N-acetyl-beta-L-altrosamine transaminase